MSDRRKLYVAEQGRQYLMASIFAAKNTMKARMDMNSCPRLKMEYIHILIPREIFWIQHRNLYKSIEFEDYAFNSFHIHIFRNHLLGNIFSRKFEAFRIKLSMVGGGSGSWSNSDGAGSGKRYAKRWGKTKTSQLEHTMNNGQRRHWFKDGAISQRSGYGIRNHSSDAFRWKRDAQNAKRKAKEGKT